MPVNSQPRAHQTPEISETAVALSSNSTYSICCEFVVQHFYLLWICFGFWVYWVRVITGLTSINWLIATKCQIQMTTMFFLHLCLLSATTLITLVADADATKYKRWPRRKHRMWVMKYLHRRECYGAYNSLRDLQCVLSVDVIWRHVNSLPWLARTVQQVHSKSCAKVHVFDLLWTYWRISICCTTSRTTVRYVEMLWICYTVCCTTNPQQIE